MNADERKPQSDAHAKTAEYVFTETRTIKLTIASIARLTPAEAERILGQIKVGFAAGNEVPGSLVAALFKRTAQLEKIPKPRGLKQRSASVAIGEAQTKI